MRKPAAPGPNVLVTALVLAGQRPGIDPLASAAGVSHKCLIPVAGTPMIAHVVGCLRRCPIVDGIACSIEDPTLLGAAVPELAGPKGPSIRASPSDRTPSRSVLAAVETLPAAFPLLVTTADHPLLTPAMVEAFVAEASATTADIVVGVAREATLQSKYPQVKRTYLRFRDGGFSGCNLFLIRTPAGLEAVRFWRRVEQTRKRPWRLLLAFGVRPFLAFLVRRPTLEGALAVVSSRIGVCAHAVEIGDADAAIDVDKLEDLALVEEIFRDRRRLSDAPGPLARSCG